MESSVDKKPIVFVEHNVGELDGLKQHCVICGKAISDYTNMVTDKPGEPLPAWPVGSLYQTKEGNPIIALSAKPDNRMYPDRKVIIEKCQ